MYEKGKSTCFVRMSITPETYRKMNGFITDIYEWERDSSDMEDDNDFGNIYDMNI